VPSPVPLKAVQGLYGLPRAATGQPEGRPGRLDKPWNGGEPRQTIGEVSAGLVYAWL
jgi:hypothetical protein